MESNLIALSVPVFFALIALELLVARAKRRALYRFQDSVNSLSCGITQQAIGIGLKVWTVGSYFFVYDALAFVELDAGAWWVRVVGALAVDLAYYAFHRASHRVGFIWATHVVHHQSEEYNLTTALRQSALQGVMSAAFYWPLALLGLPPAVFLVLSTFNTLYQFWIHTRLIDRLGPLEWIFNTPSHHRVHHGIDPKYVDKNYAGVLIVWDRLFGTFQAEEEEPAYGTVKPLRSWNPLWANVDHWLRMAKVARSTRRWRDKVWAFLAPPEWLPADQGGPVTVPEVDHATREKYERPPRPGLSPYVAAQLALVTVALVRVLTSYATAPALHTGLLIAFVLAGVTAWGGLFERKRWAPWLEGARHASGPALALLVAPSAWVLEATVSALIVAIASGAWLAVLHRRAPSAARAPVVRA